MVMPDKYIT